MTSQVDAFHKQISGQEVRVLAFEELLRSFTSEMFIEALTMIDAAINHNNPNGAMDILDTQISRKKNSNEPNLRGLTLNYVQYEKMIRLITLCMSKEITPNQAIYWFIRLDDQIKFTLESYSKERNLPIDKYVIYIKFAVYYLLAKNKIWIDRN